MYRINEIVQIRPDLKLSAYYNNLPVTRLMYGSRGLQCRIDKIIQLSTFENVNTFCYLITILSKGISAFYWTESMLQPISKPSLSIF